jgi:methionyl-tRNA formyltransferase
MNTNSPKIAYFGGEPLGVPVLTELQKAGIVPSIILCNPDRPVGRKQELTSPPVKQWALENNIEVFQPEEIKSDSFKQHMSKMDFDLFIVVAYNKIMPKWLVDLPKHGTINVHPSLLPLLRGASPIRTSILEDMKDQCGVTIMQMDEKMDHGPILAQELLQISDEQWPIAGNKLDEQLAQLGGRLLAQTVPKVLSGDITLVEQFHEKATYCGRLDRSMGELSIDPYNLPTGDEAYQTLLKIRAFDGFPGTFFIHKGKRIKVLDAHIKQDTLHITKVIPEGKKEMNFETYLQILSQ